MRKVIGCAILVLLAIGMIALWCWVYGWKVAVFAIVWTIVVGGLIMLAMYLISDE